MKKPSGLPLKSRVGNRVEAVEIDPRTYFLGTRMERAGRLVKGQALMLAATLKEPAKRGKTGAPTKGKRK